MIDEGVTHACTRGLTARGGRVGLDEVADGVFRIAVHSPFGTGPTNAYVLRGERVGLFDTGPANAIARDDLLGGLGLLGLSPGDVELLVISHGHVDHHGLADEFPAARVVTGRREVHKLTDLQSHLEQYGSVAGGLLLSWGVPPQTREGIAKFISGLLRAATSVPGARPIDEGHTLEGFGPPLVVRELPGHTEGLIGLHRPSDGVLLAGDHLLPTITPNPGLYTLDTPPRSGLADYVISLKRVLELEPTLVLPGHGDPFGDVAGRVEEVLLHHSERLEVVRAAAGGGQTVFEIAARLFPGVEPGHVFLAGREVYGHLQILEQDGRVSCSAVAGPDIFAAA